MYTTTAVGPSVGSTERRYIQTIAAEFGLRPDVPWLAPRYPKLVARGSEDERRRAFGSWDG
jgi:hypothetical protein